MLIPLFGQEGRTDREKCSKYIINFRILPNLAISDVIWMFHIAR